MAPIERALVATVPWLAGGLLLSVPLLLVDVGNDPTVWFIVQLTVLVVFAIGLAHAVVGFGSQGWFVGSGWSATTKAMSSGISLVVLVTGTVGLVTLASSAALRFDPSTQFLQVISALDIAWVVAAVTVGAYRAWGRFAATVAGIVIAVVCVWSIATYLDHVGFGPAGQWIVSATDLMKFVLPYDTAAAIGAVSVFVVGMLAVGRQSSQAIEQPNPQS